MYMSKVTKQRDSDKAYDALKQAIIQLEMAPNTPLNENELMERFGVGRTPLREALVRLSQDELVYDIPRRGFFVANIAITDPLHVFEVRQQLEAFSARLAAERATPNHIVEFHKFLDYATAYADSSDFQWNLETDRKLHQLVAKASGNPFLQQSLDRLFTLTIRVLYMYRLKVSMVKEELAAYKSVVSAIEKHDPEAAEKAMRGHLGFPTMELKLVDGSPRQNASFEKT